MTLEDLARQTGKHPVDAWLDLVTADGLDAEFLAGLLNTDEKIVGDLIAHPLTLITLSDAGAHLSLMCDAGYSSTLLGKWVRGLGRLSLPAAVKRLTDDPARAYRIPGRGRLAPGYWADVVAVDPATVDALPPEWVHDLPGRRAAVRLPRARRRVEPRQRPSRCSSAAAWWSADPASDPAACCGRSTRDAADAGQNRTSRPAERPGAWFSLLA